MPSSSSDDDDVGVELPPGVLTGLGHDIVGLMVESDPMLSLLLLLMATVDAV